MAVAFISRYLWKLTPHRASLGIGLKSHSAVGILYSAFGLPPAAFSLQSSVFAFALVCDVCSL
jgi:hypothetical protein